MKVLIYSRSFGGKTITFIYNTTFQLASTSGIEVLLVTHNYENSIEFPPPCKVVQLKSTDLSLIDKIKWRLYKKNILLNYKKHSFAKDLNSIVSDFRPDIIHCNFGNDGLFIFDNLSKMNKKNTKLFFHFHGYDASNLIKTSPIYIKRLKNILNAKKAFPIFVSKMMLDNVKRYGIVPDKDRVLYYGTNILKFKRKTQHSSYKTFLQVSSFREKKGHIYTIKAFNIFLDSVQTPEKYKLILAGGGELFEEIKYVASKSKYNSQIEFPGWVNHSQAVILMDKADFFVHHSITASNGDQEGIPNAIMEAMAMELPIISTIHAGIPELVEDGVNGYLVEEKDVKSYAEKMINILSWDYKIENRNKVESMFEQSKHVEKLLCFYKEVL